MKIKLPDFFKTKTTVKPKSEYEVCCAYCEHCKTTGTSENQTFFCTVRKKDVTPQASCAKFSYDLLKRKPRRMMNMPSIDPESLDN